MGGFFYGASDFPAADATPPPNPWDAGFQLPGPAFSPDAYARQMEQAALAYRAARYTGATRAWNAAMADAYDEADDEVFRASGQRLGNPIRARDQALLGNDAATRRYADPITDPVARWHNQLAIMAASNPRLAAIAQRMTPDGMEARANAMRQQAAGDYGELLGSNPLVAFARGVLMMPQSLAGAVSTGSPEQVAQLASGGSGRGVSLLGRFGIGALDNMVRQGLIEPAVIEDARSMGEDRTTGQIAIDIALAGVLGGTLGAVMHSGGSRPEKTSAPDSAEGSSRRLPPPPPPPQYIRLIPSEIADEARRQILAEGVERDAPDFIERVAARGQELAASALEQTVNGDEPIIRADSRLPEMAAQGRPEPIVVHPGEPGSGTAVQEAAAGRAESLIIAAAQRDRATVGAIYDQYGETPFYRGIDPAHPPSAEQGRNNGVFFTPSRKFAEEFPRASDPAQRQVIEARLQEQTLADFRDPETQRRVLAEVTDPYEREHLQRRIAQMASTGTGHIDWVIGSVPEIRDAAERAGYSGMWLDEGGGQASVMVFRDDGYRVVSPTLHSMTVEQMVDDILANDAYVRGERDMPAVSERLPEATADEVHAALRQSDEGPRPEAGTREDVTIGGVTRPRTFESFDAISLGFDPQTFQFRRSAERFNGVESWDGESAGKIVVYEAADGRLYVADGHQRVALAQALEARDGTPINLDGYVYRERDGWTPRDVRLIAAQKNLREGVHDPIDAAQLIRDMPDVLDSSIPMRSPAMRTARALARLSDHAWQKVRDGALSPDLGATIGEHAADHPEVHGALADEFAARPPVDTREAAISAQEAVQGAMVREQRPAPPPPHIEPVDLEKAARSATLRAAHDRDQEALTQSMAEVALERAMRGDIGEVNPQDAIGTQSPADLRRMEDAAEALGLEPDKTELDVAAAIFARPGQDLLNEALDRQGLLNRRRNAGGGPIIADAFNGGLLDTFRISDADVLGWFQNEVTVGHNRGHRAEEYRFTSRPGLKRKDVGLVWDEYAPGRASAYTYFRNQTIRQSYALARGKDVRNAVRIFTQMVLGTRAKLIYDRPQEIKFYGATPAHSRLYRAMLEHLNADGYTNFAWTEATKPRPTQHFAIVRDDHVDEFLRTTERQREQKITLHGSQWESSLRPERIEPRARNRLDSARLDAGGSTSPSEVGNAEPAPASFAQAVEHNAKVEAPFNPNDFENAAELRDAVDKATLPELEAVAREAGVDGEARTRVEYYNVLRRGPRDRVPPGRGVSPDAIGDHAPSVGGRAGRQTPILDTLLGRRPDVETNLWIGPKSAMWNGENASRAAQMESAGASAQEIWAQTGTFRDAAGAWRQETGPVAFNQAYPNLRTHFAPTFPWQSHLDGSYFGAGPLNIIQEPGSPVVRAHELNHLIARHEGFAPGSNRLRAWMSGRSYAADPGEINAETAAQRQFYRPELREQNPPIAGSRFTPNAPEAGAVETGTPPRTPDGSASPGSAMSREADHIQRIVDDLKDCQ